MAKATKDKAASRILFVNRYFFPDQSATSQILGDLAFHLAAQGRNVHVLTARSLYDNASVILPSRDVVGGVVVHRIWTARFGGNSLFGKAINYLTFYVASFVGLFWYARKDDIVIAMTDPPMLSVIVCLVAMVRKFNFVNWLQDIYPEIAIELGVKGFKGVLGRTIIALRNHSLHLAKKNVVIGEAMTRRLLGFGLDKRKICTIHNWADDVAIRPFAKNNPLRVSWNLQNKFIVGYSGNLGRAHEAETILAAAELLRAHDEIVFLFIGGRRRGSELEKVCSSRNLRNFVFLEYQPRSELFLSLSLPDVHWLSLKPELEGLILPSKFYGIAAAGRPMIAITNCEGELASLINKYACGAVVAPEQARKLADVLLELLEKPDEKEQMGANARKMLDENFTKVQALMLWEGVIEAIERCP